MLFPFNVEKWRKWVVLAEGQQFGDPAPIERVLRWCQIESGGNACAVGRVDNGHVYEAGLGQTYFSSPDAVVFGATVDDVRADCGVGTSMPTNLTDERRIFHARMLLLTVKDHRRRARERLSRNGGDLAEGSDEFWRWVKLVHAAPAMFDFLPACKRALGKFPTWSEFKSWFGGLSYESRYAINKTIAQRAAATPAPGKDDYMTRVWRNCEHFANIGGSSGVGSLELVMLLALGAAAFLLPRFLA